MRRSNCSLALLSAGLALLGPPLACCRSSGQGALDAGPDAGSVLPSPALSPLAACQELATALSALEVRCGRLALADEARYAASLCSGGVALRQAEFDAGTLAFSAKAVACEAAFRQAQPCNVSPDAESGCGQLGWGSLPQGDLCDDPLGCQSGLYCQRLSSSAPCGSCAPDPGLGGPCGPGAFGAPCGAGLCDGAACQVAVGQGDQCYAQGAVCDPGLSCQTGICNQPAGVGASCGADSDCQDGLFCDPSALVCTPRGQPFLSCDAGVCGFGLACVAPDGGGPTCLPLAAGGPCLSGSDGGLCLEGEACGPDGGCRAEPGPGEACDGQLPCLAGGCVQGRCQPLTAGQPCRQDLDCASGRCGGGGVTAVCGPDCS